MRLIINSEIKVLDLKKEDEITEECNMMEEIDYHDQFEIEIIEDELNAYQQKVISDNGEFEEHVEGIPTN